MYDTSLTSQSLPSKDYLYLLGVAMCTFNSNNAFIVENIVHTDAEYSWYALIDLESGKLKREVAETITKVAGSNIQDTFSDIVAQRNRIFHGFQITDNDEQVLATKDKKTQERFIITTDYLKEFIRKNNLLSDLLHDYRKSIHWADAK
ncbi:hypothetical protein [Bifidobacterium myosotis]|uniref:Selenium binding protein n=1 Tax=Bifidobacterium myosotis TaxID=1630166 RepID=A0A5M9ZLL5_9BIFI|nr:hypothetical protein [Bifidobacterium myosotis]KAA8828385.1 hypothetical protein EMO91_04270 [Bifidobacterium myosotis]